MKETMEVFSFRNAIDCSVRHIEIFLEKTAARTPRFTIRHQAKLITKSRPDTDIRTIKIV